MPYPLISEYVEAIRNAEDNFDELTNLRPVLDEDKKPVMSGGNFAVVFKMKDVETEKLYAIKCFTREQEGRAEAYKQIAKELENVFSTYLTPIKYLDKELFVDSANNEETEFPVLLMDWVKGQTLDKYIRENLDDQYALEMLAYQFSRLAMWLLPQPFAHGDLKPDNIIVREDGTLTLVDYDGMYVPAMKGQKARELGSPDFRHPSRTIEEFNEHIDDFPIASILLSLKAIALQPTLLEEYGASDRLLLSEEDYRNISQSQFLKQVFPSDNMELNKLMNLFMLALSENNLSGVSSSLFNLQKPEEPEVEVYSTKVTEEDLANAWTDEFGVKYSADRKRLLKIPDDIKNYSIRNGAIVLCEEAFDNCADLKSITIPQSVNEIGHGVLFSTFGSCIDLENISVDEHNRFFDSRDNCNAIINTNTNVLIAGCSKSTIPYGVTKIGDFAFSGSCIITLTIPNGVTSIGVAAFSGCRYLESITLPESVEIIEGVSFHGCLSLTTIIIPNDATCIGQSAFGYCDRLTSITLPRSLKDIGKDVFEGCSNLTSIFIPVGTKSKFEELLPEYKDKLVEQDEPDSYNTEVTKEDLANAWIDEYGAKYSNDKTRLLKVPRKIKEYSVRSGTKVVCDFAFTDVLALMDLTPSISKIIIPKTVIKIGESAFSGCDRLISITIPDSVLSIGDSAFKNCKSLNHVSLPPYINKIGSFAFFGCSSLQSIDIPNSVVEIGYSAFNGCESLTEITIPKSVDHVGEGFLAGCKCKIVNKSSHLFYENGIMTDQSDVTIVYCNPINTVVSIPKSVRRIGDYAFAGCDKLEHITLNDSISFIGFSAFEGCSSLIEISIPPLVKSINSSTFKNCVSLKTIFLPDALVDIGYAAFMYCRSLLSVKIPASVGKRIGRNAFTGCMSLIAIYVSEETSDALEEYDNIDKPKYRLVRIVK